MESPDVRSVSTGDGSSTLFAPRFNEHYHSIHGAVNESKHVFIEAGLRLLLDRKPASIRIFEMGFGTGLNALLTALRPNDCNLHYACIEAYPLNAEQWSALNFCAQLDDPACAEIFRALHEAPWDQITEIHPRFHLHKQAISLASFQAESPVDLVYWDAFAPSAQPELWTAEVFQRVFTWLAPGGIWVTYSAKGDVRRALQSVGFEVERIPGPPGKREMLRAQKPH